MQFISSDINYKGVDKVKHLLPIEKVGMYRSTIEVEHSFLKGAR